MNNPCPCCGQTIKKPCKVNVRRNLLPALKMLTINPPMATEDIKKCFEKEPSVFADIGSHFYQFEYFRLIRKENGRWQATSEAHKFFDGNTVIPEFVYVLNGERVATPTGEEEPHLVTVSELCPHLATNDLPPSLF